MIRRRPYFQTRDAAGDLATRTFQVRADSVDEQNRSVEAVLATETPVRVYDLETWERIDEVLLVAGAQLPDQVPLLACHRRWELDDQLGSVRTIRTEEGPPPQIAGRLHFAADDEAAERAWNKVKQKHLRDVSVGYEVLTYTNIKPGETATVAGRQWTATARRLRVVTSWKLKETSVTPIGADEQAKTRNHRPHPQGNPAMPAALRDFLTRHGLRADATEDQAWAFYHALGGQQRAEADALRGQAEPPAADPPPAPTPQPARSDPPPADPPAPTPARSDPPPADPPPTGEAAERQRQREIRGLAVDDVPAELLARALDDGWTVGQASTAFLAAVRDARPPAVGPEGSGPAIHSRSRETDVHARSLASGMLAAHGLDPTQHRFCAEFTGQRGGRLTEQDADLGDRLRDLSAVDLCRECALLDTGRRPTGRSDAIRTATSGGTLTYVFGTSVYAHLIRGWEEVGDTTVGWCEEEDVANFQQQEDISLKKGGGLRRLARGDTAEHATLSDSRETYRIARYAEKFVVDEQDILDDRLGALLRMPEELGEEARRTRPDMVYALLLENPTMTDTGEAFNSTAVTTAGGHANLGTAVLNSDGLKAGISAIVKQRSGRTTTNPGKQLNLRPKFLLCPAALEWTARGLTASEMLAKLFADDSDPWYPTLNLLAKEGLRVVPDDRLGAIGVRDPRTGTARTGLDTNWFLTTGRGIRVAYRLGTGRLPQMRSFVLDKGQWGVGWDINLDIGAAIVDWQPLYKSTGAGG